MPKSFQCKKRLVMHIFSLSHFVFLPNVRTTNDRPRSPSAPGTLCYAKIIFDIRSFMVFEMPLALTNIYIELFTKFNDNVRFGNTPSVPKYRTFWFSYIYSLCYALRYTLYKNNASKNQNIL